MIINKFMRIIFLKIFIFCLLFINNAFTHELRPTIANLDIIKNEKTFDANLSLRINLESIIAGIDPKHTNSKDSEKSNIYDNLRKLDPEQLLREFENKFNNIENFIFLETKKNKFNPVINLIDIPQVENLELIRDTVIKINFNNIESSEFKFFWNKNFGPIILRVNSEEFGELHTEIIKNKSYSSIIKIEKNKNNFFKNFYNYLILGYEHILPKGLDHILFVLALFLLSSNIKTLILQISLFTIAHTITLFLGVFNIIKISSYIVEPIIALSIAYVGIENLFKNNLSKSRTIIIFIFGLLHGLGFAGVLSDIGLVKELFVSSLISFNIGVELGQISTIVLAYLIIKLPFSKMDWYSTRITKPISLLISIIGIFWFFERIFF